MTVLYVAADVRLDDVLVLLQVTVIRRLPVFVASLRLGCQTARAIVVDLQA